MQKIVSIISYTSSIHTIFCIDHRNNFYKSLIILAWLSVNRWLFLYDFHWKNNRWLQKIKILTKYKRHFNLIAQLISGFFLNMALIYWWNYSFINIIIYYVKIKGHGMWYWIRKYFFSVCDNVSALCCLNHASVIFSEKALEWGFPRLTIVNCLFRYMNMTMVWITKQKILMLRTQYTITAI